MTATTNPVADQYVAQAEEIANAAARLVAIAAKARELHMSYRGDELQSAAFEVADLAAKLAGGDANPDYNGWPNRETWAVSLHLGNDETLQTDAADVVRSSWATSREPWPDADPASLRRARLRDAGDALREYVEDLLAGVVDYDGHPSAQQLLAGDLLTLARVDFAQVAEGFAEDLD